MRWPRVRLTPQTMMASVAILAMATGSLVALHRESASRYLRALATYEADYSRACLRRIPEDIQRASTCGRWAAEGRGAPQVAVYTTGRTRMNHRGNAGKANAVIRDIPRSDARAHDGSAAGVRTRRWRRDLREG
jgi:hypothetical protein